jgi:hypothetical protein
MRPKRRVQTAVRYRHDVALLPLWLASASQWLICGMVLLLLLILLLVSLGVVGLSRQRPRRHAPRCAVPPQLLLLRDLCEADLGGCVLRLQLGMFAP